MEKSALLCLNGNENYFSNNGVELYHFRKANFAKNRIVEYAKNSN